MSEAIWICENDDHGGTTVYLGTGYSGSIWYRTEIEAVEAAINFDTDRIEGASRSRRTWKRRLKILKAKSLPSLNGEGCGHE